MASIDINFVDTSLAASPVPTTGVITSLTTGVEGFGNSGIVGDTINPLHAEFNYNLTLPNQGATASGDVVRVIIFVDHQTNSGTAAVTDILASSSITSFPNFNNVERFTILRDCTDSVDVSAMNNASSAVTIANCRFTVGLGDQSPVTFGTTGANVVTSNDICALFISTTGVAVSTGVGRLFYSMV